MTNMSMCDQALGQQRLIEELSRSQYGQLNSLQQAQNCVQYQYGYPPPSYYQLLVEPVSNGWVISYQGRKHVAEEREQVIEILKKLLVIP